MNDTFRRRHIFRAAFVLVWILLGVILFISSRGHTLLLDNRNLDDLKIRAPDLITVSVDGKAPLEFLRGDRDRLILGGIKHSIRVEFSDGSPPFEGSFRLPLRGDMYLLSIPKLIRGIDPAVELFHAVPEARAQEEDEVPVSEERGYSAYRRPRPQSPVMAGYVTAAIRSCTSSLTISSGVL